MNDLILNAAVSAAVLIGVTHTADAELVLESQFNPTDIGGIVSLAYDAGTDGVWVYGDSAGDIRKYSPAGAFLASVPRPGESANDADLDIAPELFTMNGTLIPAGSLLFFNGESGPAEVYAIDPDTGVVLETLNTAFGLSHVVGGAYHRERNTFFLVQDRVPSGSTNDSVVAEIDPDDGSVLNTFKIDDILPGFTVNYGDIDIDPIFGGLYIVSSDETSVAHFSATGSFIRTLDLPVGVSGLSGIGIADDESGAAWVTSSGGVISQLGGFPKTVLLGDLDGDGFVGIADLNIILGNWNMPAPQFDLLSGDPSGDGYVGIADLNLVLGNWNAGTPPNGSASIPEPGALSVLGVIGVLGVYRGRPAC